MVHQKRLPHIEAGIPMWMEKIKNLLNHHHVQLFSSKHQLWVVMKAKTDGRVHVHLSERIEDAQRIAKLHEERRTRTGNTKAD
jgi:hypothetical protein